jgi:hypothetical protein
MLGNGIDRFADLPGKFLDEVFYQQGYIFFSLPQRRN